MKNLIVVFLSTCCSSVFAQSIKSDTISWTVTGLSDSRAHMHQDYRCEFITYGANKIAWVQRHQTEEFLVTDSPGEWSDIRRNGAIQYKFTYDGKPARLLFTRSNDITRIEMEVTEDESNVMPYVFDVALIEKK